ncbi:MAG: MFS transporter [Reyranella sp.]|uniref:MFS transporter n=1 Tax=Reyranella sp. TaxID=1929291 RepID=UPI003D0BC3D7
MQRTGRVLIVVVAAALMMSVAMGTRQTFGLFLGPLAQERGLAITTIALAIALHNLVWGLAQPLAGAAADRFGAAPVVILGAIAYAAGLALTAITDSGVLLVLGMGLLVGIGMSCTTFGVVLTAVGRAATAENRSLAMGLSGAGGSLGQVALVPISLIGLEDWGIAASLVGLGVLLLMVAPVALLLERRGQPTTPHAVSPGTTPRLGEALTEAMKHLGYRLLTLGFFTCGFQLAFIGTYLPDYLTLCHMPLGLGATALSLIGLFNIAGSWACGWLGGRFRQQQVLGWLYLVRGVTIAAFFLLPKSTASVVIFAAVMGLTWLGTVPLTSGWLAKVFGTSHLGTLFGVCFFSHQIGSFIGAWLGGVLFELTGSYAIVWILTAAAGLMAALLNFPIKDAVPRPVARLA